MSLFWNAVLWLFIGLFIGASLGVVIAGLCAAAGREPEGRWIPVSERLPKRDGFYLVLENVNQVAGYYHWCKQFGWNTDGGRINIQSVTHWMPLPEPPEEIK